MTSTSSLRYAWPTPITAIGNASPHGENDLPSYDTHQQQHQHHGMSDNTDQSSYVVAGSVGAPISGRERLYQVHRPSILSSLSGDGSGTGNGGVGGNGGNGGNDSNGNNTMVSPLQSPSQGAPLLTSEVATPLPIPSLSSSSSLPLPLPTVDDTAMITPLTSMTLPSSQQKHGMTMMDRKAQLLLYPPHHGNNGSFGTATATTAPTAPITSTKGRRTAVHRNGNTMILRAALSTRRLAHRVMARRWDVLGLISLHCLPFLTLIAIYSIPFNAPMPSSSSWRHAPFLIALGIAGLLGSVSIPFDMRLYDPVLTFTRTQFIWNAIVYSTYAVLCYWAPMWFDVFPTPYSWVFGVVTSGLVLQYTVLALTPSSLRTQPHWQSNFKGFWAQVTFFNIIVLLSMGFLILFYRSPKSSQIYILCAYHMLSFILAHGIRWFARTQPRRFYWPRLFGAELYVQMFLSLTLPQTTATSMLVLGTILQLFQPVRRLIMFTETYRRWQLMGLTPLARMVGLRIGNDIVLPIPAGSQLASPQQAVGSDGTPKNGRNSPAKGMPGIGMGMGMNDKLGMGVINNIGNGNQIYDSNIPLQPIPLSARMASHVQLLSSLQRSSSHSKIAAVIHTAHHPTIASPILTTKNAHHHHDDATIATAGVATVAMDSTTTPITPLTDLPAPPSLIPDNDSPMTRPRMYLHVDTAATPASNIRRFDDSPHHYTVNTNHIQQPINNNNSHTTDKSHHSNGNGSGDNSDGDGDAWSRPNRIPAGVASAPTAAIYSIGAAPQPSAKGGLADPSVQTITNHHHHQHGHSTFGTTTATATTTSMNGGTYDGNTMISSMEDYETPYGKRPSSIFRLHVLVLSLLAKTCGLVGYLMIFVCQFQYGSNRDYFPHSSDGSQTDTVIIWTLISLLLQLSFCIFVHIWVKHTYNISPFTITMDECRRYYWHFMALTFLAVYALYGMLLAHHAVWSDFVTGNTASYMLSITHVNQTAQLLTN